jgi:DNA mismatch repair protein MutS2
LPVSSFRHADSFTAMTGSRHFVVGDHVHVASIGKGIVREVRNGGRYLIDVKGRHMVATEGQMTPAAARSTHPAERVDDPASSHEVTAGPRPSVTIDLHGLTADEAVAALDTSLNDAILAGTAEVRVIHGRSGGRLKAAVHARLKALPVVRSFRIDETNRGVTLVAL